MTRRKTENDSLTPLAKAESDGWLPGVLVTLLCGLYKDTLWLHGTCATQTEALEVARQMAHSIKAAEVKEIKP